MNAGSREERKEERIYEEGKEERHEERQLSLCNERFQGVKLSSSLRLEEVK